MRSTRACIKSALQGQGQSLARGRGKTIARQHRVS
jgi:hypothetical protein